MNPGGQRQSLNTLVGGISPKIELEYPADVGG